MKKSYYNFLFPGEDGKTILYNSRTGAMAELDVEHTEQFKNWTEAELEEKASEFANALYENGFMIADNVSELDMIRYDMHKAKFGGNVFKIVIAPTQNCNFGCKYCYEKEVIQSKYMNEDIQKVLIKYVEENLVPSGELHVCWYGGEPLMALDIIESLSKKFLELCKEKNITYYADMITNGYLLEEEVAERLVRCEISQIQITIDGNEELHNRRRPLTNGEGTYKTIWNNLVMMQKFKNNIKIVLRVNVDKENREAIYEIRSKIKEVGMSEYVFLYLGKVLDVKGCHNSEQCYSSKEFSDLEQKFVCDELQTLRYKYPTPKPIACGADSIRTMIVDYQGDMYKSKLVYWHIHL